MNPPMHPEAEREMIRATMRYALDNPTVAIRFNEALARAVDGIAQAPRMYPLADDAPDGFEVRNYPLHRFPYRCVYWISGERVIIIAIAHTSRRPGYWHDRLTDETPESP